MQKLADVIVLCSNLNPWNFGSIKGIYRNLTHDWKNDIVNKWLKIVLVITPIPRYAFQYDIYKEQKILDKMHSDYKNEERNINSLNRRLERNEHRITKGKLTQLQTYKLLQENKQITKDISHSEHTLASLHGSITQQALRVGDLKADKRF